MRNYLDVLLKEPHKYYAKLIGLHCTELLKLRKLATDDALQLIKTTLTKALIPQHNAVVVSISSSLEDLFEDMCRRYQNAKYNTFFYP